MSTIAVISAILTLIAGIGIFLIACQMMSTNLESASSEKLKKLFAKASGSKMLGVGIGTFATAAIQSSGATTVMVIGFVNAGIISLAQAATIIYGANIGTTITAQIVALGMFGGNTLSTSVMFSAFAGIGAFMLLFAKRETIKQMGGILAGFGMLFVGLTMMSSSMSDFAQQDSVKVFLAQINHPLLLVLIGAVFTAIIQSSSVMTSIAIAMVVTGLVSLNQGIYLTMGSNIGSCVVAILAVLSSGTNAKRTALIHLIFNCSGVVIFLFLGLMLNVLSRGTLSFGTLFNTLLPSAPQTQLAMFHTIFNVATVIIVLPLTNFLVQVVCGIMPETSASVDRSKPRLYYIDDNMLKTPPIAVRQTKSEIINMASIAMRNFNRSLDIITTLDYSEIDKFRIDEHELNFLNREIVNFVVNLSERPQLNEHDRKYLASTFRTVRDIERIGDYGENIIEYADTLKISKKNFSKTALAEINRLRLLINKLYAEAMSAYSNENVVALEQANAIEDQIDDFTKAMEEQHIQRLSDGICSPLIGAQYLTLTTNAERVADHLINVAKSIRNI